MLIVKVLIEYAVSSLDRPFSYLYRGDNQIRVGTRVLVSFNNKEIVGYVIEVESSDLSKTELEEQTGFKLEEVIEVLDEFPLLNVDLMNLLDIISSYYLCPKISFLQAMLPPSLNVKKSTLKAPKIAYDKIVIIQKYDETDLTSKQIELLRFIAQEKRIYKNEIKSASMLNKLLDKGLVKIVYEEKRRFQLPEYDAKNKPVLTKHQLDTINCFFNSNDCVFLIEGVTGSGKTEVYLNISERILKDNKKILMLVSEISLTPMMVEYYISRFGKDVAVLHSGLTSAEKYDEYRKIAKGDCKIVIGARSAIFAPLDNIGLIIIDEEHADSYKHDKMPFYHARDIAIIRAKMHNAKVILGSATPSFESRARAQNGVYHILKMNKRINEFDLPKTHVINMLDYSNIDRDSFIFSKQLRLAIFDRLSKHEQIMLLINRRGYSTTVSCRKCGYVFKCPNCGIPLTYHKKDNMMKCHHCDHVEVVPNECPECKNEYLIKTGFGTEKILEEVKRLFPQAKAAILDSDVSKSKKTLMSILDDFKNNKIDILIGTQMIAKGLDFPNITLVGIVLADIGLNMPNYRNAEKTFELITQAIGRSGRSDKKGEAYVQTYMPNHYAIKLASKQDFESFYLTEMLNRKELNYPPYCFLSSITVKSNTENNAENNALNIKNYLENYSDKFKIIGPSTPYLAREGNLFVRTILVKYKDFDFAHKILEECINKYKKLSNSQILFDIDPYNF